MRVREEVGDAGGVNLLKAQSDSLLRTHKMNCETSHVGLLPGELTVITCIRQCKFHKKQSGGGEMKCSS